MNWRDIGFIRWLWKLLSVTGFVVGLVAVYLVVSGNFDWRWLSFEDAHFIWHAFQCGSRAGRGLAAYLLAMSAGFAIILFGQSPRLREKYIGRTILVYAFAVVVVVVTFAFSFDQAGQPIISCE